MLAARARKRPIDAATHSQLRGVRRRCEPLPRAAIRGIARAGVGPPFARLFPFGRSAPLDDGAKRVGGGGPCEKSLGQTLGCLRSEFSRAYAPIKGKPIPAAQPTQRPARRGGGFSARREHHTPAGGS